MKKLAVFVAMALAIAIVGCQSTPSYPTIGTVDKAKVELLANGKAKVVDIVSFNDFHATLLEEPTGKNPGVGKFATEVKNVLAANPNTLLVSAGDNYQGSALSVITKGKVVSEFFKLLGVKASAVGNHEFDWGADLIPGWSTDGGFPFLACNIFDKATGKPAAFAKPYQIFSVGGHTIALVGVSTLDTLTTVKAENIAAYEFKVPADCVKAQVAALQANEKPEVIIVLGHIPSVADKADATKALSVATRNELDAICQVPGVNAVITGHSHNPVAGFNNGVPVVQAYYNGRTLAKLSIAFDDKGGAPTITPTLDEFYKTKDKIAIDPAAQAIYDNYYKEYGTALGEVVATLTADLPHTPNTNVTPMGKWVCDAMKAKYGVQVVLMNGGGLRKGFVAGPVKVQDMWDLMPFDNYTVTFTLTGAALKEAIAWGIDSKGFNNGQYSGVKVTYDPTKTDVTKIVAITLDDGTAIDDAKTYTCATNDFQFGGGDGYKMLIANGKNVNNTLEPVRNVLIDAARAQKTITPPSVAGLCVAATPAPAK